MKEEIKIALLGNPNSGKTTMFNALTGSSQHVGNWPGVTVEKKEGRYKENPEMGIVDLPGIYSMSAYSPEEKVSGDYIRDGHPDAIVNIVDANNLERNLYLTMQALESDIPVVVALNMMDIAGKNGLEFDTKKMSAILGCPVIGTSALKKTGLKELMDSALAESKKKRTAKAVYSDDAEKIISEIRKISGTDRRTSIKLLEKDPAETQRFGKEKFEEKINPIIEKLEEEYDDDSESIIINERYAFVENTVSSSIIRKPDGNEKTLSDRIDGIVTGKWTGIPVFLLIMFGIYYIAVETVGGKSTKWTNDVFVGEWIMGAVNSALESVGAGEIVSGLLTDGVVAGFGAVMGFLPQMIVLFILLAILDACGYMARIAFVMDRVFRRFGLSGKSAIPAMIGLGCGIPAVTASRTIETERERKITVMTTTFMPCSAKLPVIALIVGALFGGSALVASSMYAVGIVSILLGGLILGKFKSMSGEPSPFIMELPGYRLPGVKGVLYETGERAWSFVKRAGTIIVVSAVLIWFLSRFDWSLNYLSTEDVSKSMLASIGSAMAVFFVPLGWGQEWEFTVATITGLVAKENVVGTLGVLFGYSEVSEAGNEIWSIIGGMMTPLAGYSFLLFNMLCAPCFAAIGAMRTELGSGKDTLKAVGFQTAFAYSFALAVYQIGLLVTGKPEIWLIAAVAVLLLSGYILFAEKPFAKISGRLAK